MVDVALDIRAGSSTFLKYYIQELTPDNNLMVAVPEGFASYQALEPDSEIVYFNTAFYEPSMGRRRQSKRSGRECCMAPPVTNLSPRDESTPFLTPDFKGLAI